jgi:hypothetical protein
MTECLGAMVHEAFLKTQCGLSRCVSAYAFVKKFLADT